MKTLFATLQLIILVSFESYGQPLPALIPYFDGSRWGYCDNANHLVIKPLWDSVSFFTEGRALVYVNKGKTTATCIIDATGNYIIPPARNWTGDWNGKKGQQLNAFDSGGTSGKWGMIDTNNNVLVPYEYANPDIISAFHSPCNGYQYDETGRRWFLVASKNGKQGVIDDKNKVLVPFQYEIVGCPLDYQTAGAPFYFYVDNGQYQEGIVDTNGIQVMAPVYHDIRYVAHTKAPNSPMNGFLFSNANNEIGWTSAPPCKFKLPARYVDLRFYPPDLIAFRIMGESLSGIMDTNGKILIEPKYEQIFRSNDTIKVTKIELNKPVDQKIISTEKKQKKGKSTKSLSNPGVQYIVVSTAKVNPFKFYYQYLDKNTFEPACDWMEDVSREKELEEHENTPGRAIDMVDIENDYRNGYNEKWRNEREEERKRQWQYAQTHAHMVKSATDNFGREHHNNIFEFQKDSLHYKVTKCISQEKQYYAVTSDNRSDGPYYAVVDTGFHYIFPPGSDYGYDYIDFKNKIFFIKKDGSYALMDSDHKFIFPYQPMQLMQPFMLNNEWYAYGTSDRIDKTEAEINQERNGHVSDNQSKRWYPDLRLDPEKVNKTLLKNGKPVEELSEYNIIAGLDKELAGINEGEMYFLAKNIHGKQGIISLKGAILYGKVSFQHSDLIPVNSGLMLVRDSAYEKYRLVNHKDKEVFPGLAVISITHPVTTDQLLNGQPFTLGSLFKVTYWAHQKSNYFYMDNNARRFTGDIF